MQRQNDLTNGPAAAALLAVGMGSLALGLCVILSEAIKSVNKALNFYDPVGPLSGKTISTHRARILEKMGLKKNAELTLYAVGNGLIE